MTSKPKPQVTQYMVERAYNMSTFFLIIGVLFVIMGTWWCVAAWFVAFFYSRIGALFEREMERQRS